MRNLGDRALFSLLKRSKDADGLTGIAIRSEGIGIAHITRSGDDRHPRLLRCEFHPGADPGRTLAALVRQHHLDTIPCTSLMDANQSSLLLIEAPEVAPAELKAAVRWRIKELIDFPLEEAVLDVFGIDGQRGRSEMMYVVVARESTVREHIHLLESAHVKLRSIDIAELAQRNIAALLPEDQSGVALLHLTARGGLLTLTHQGNLFLARNLEFGTDQLAAELSAQDEAAGSVEPDTTGLPPGLRHMMDFIVLEIQRSLDYYESHFGLPPVGGLVVAPLSRPIPDLGGYLGGNLGLPVRLLDLTSILECDFPLGDELQASCLLAIGAALRMDEATQ